MHIFKGVFISFLIKSESGLFLVHSYGLADKLSVVGAIFDDQFAFDKEKLHCHSACVYR